MKGMKANINSRLFTSSVVDVYKMTPFEEYPQHPTSFGILISASTVQELISRSEMLNESRFVWGECLVPWNATFILDVESTLEFGRWLKGRNRNGMLTLPLEPSVLCLVDALQLSAICIQPIWRHLGVHCLNRELLGWVLDEIKTPIMLNVMDMDNSDLEWLSAKGWQSIESIEGVQ